MYAMADPSTLLALTEQLKSLGLTKYEALVYIALLQVSGATATEIHERSGVPRASVYPVLDRLVGKNLVSIAHTTPKRFNAVDPEEGIDHLMKSLGSDAVKARKQLSKIYRERSPGERGDQELIWSISGRENIRSRLLDLIAQAKANVKIILIGDYLKSEILDILVITDRAGTVQVEIATDRWEGSVPDRVKVFIRKHHEPDDRGVKVPFTGGIFLVDDRKGMVVMISPDEGATALFSESTGFLRFFSMIWDFFSTNGKKKPQRIAKNPA